MEAKAKAEAKAEDGNILSATLRLCVLNILTEGRKAELNNISASLHEE